MAKLGFSQILLQKESSSAKLVICLDKEIQNFVWRDLKDESNPNLWNLTQLRFNTPDFYI